MKLDEAIAGTLGSLDELEQELIEKQTELANESRGGDRWWEESEEA
jgi:hypothetical protein